MRKNEAEPMTAWAADGAFALKRAIFAVAALLVAFSVVALSSCGASGSSSAASTGFSAGGAAMSTPSDVGAGGASGGASSDSAVASNSEVDKVLGSLTLEQKVAQMFIVTPEDVVGAGVVVTEAGNATHDAILSHPVGGICYFDQNIESTEQVKALLANMDKYSEEACGLPLFKCVDEEGGTVNRVADDPGLGATDVGDMSTIGATGDASKAHDAAVTVGSYLKDLGFNVDFAPVADVVTDPANDVMAQRSFGSDPQLVADMVVAQVKGFSETGVLSTAKHFPGIGGASGGDSHENAISNGESMEKLKETNLVPFQAAIREGVPFIMVGHLACPTVTGTDEPASVSSAIVTDLLRKQMGYDGIIITDSMSMGAVTGYYSAADASVAAVEAGVDIVLMGSDFESSYNAVLGAVRSGKISEDRIDESVRRIIEAKLLLK